MNATYKTDMISLREHNVLAGPTGIQAARQKIYKDTFTYSPGLKPVIYGGLDITDRNAFADSQFLCPMHSGDKVYLWGRPSQNTDLQIESYGVINLTKFFMNQIKLAIELLEVLAEGSPIKPDHCYLDYEFDGIAKLSTDRQYNFQIEHSGLLTPASEAVLPF